MTETLHPDIDTKAYCDQSIRNIEGKKVKEVKGGVVKGWTSDGDNLPKGKFMEDGEVLSTIPEGVDGDAYASQTIGSIGKKE